MSEIEKYLKDQEERKANPLSNYKTCELVEELKTREGVETHWAEPYEDKNIQVNGPALVLVVID